MAQGTRWRATIRRQSHKTFNDVPQAFKLLYESAAKFFPTSWEPQWKHSRKHRRADSAADGSTRSERRDRCLVNAHFNLNEPRTALRKHKVGDWKGQARGTVPMRPAADVEALEASAQPFPDTTGPLIPEGAQKPPVRCNHDEEVLPEHCACRRRLCSQAVRFLLWCAHDGQFHLSPCAGGCGAIPCVGRQGSDPNAEWMSRSESFWPKVHGTKGTSVRKR